MNNIRELYEPFQPTLTRSGLSLSGLEANVAHPRSILSGKVHSYLQIQVSTPTQYMIMPDGTQAIFLSTKRSFLGGVQTRSYEFNLLEEGEYFGIRFFPGAFRYFFNVNLSEITNEFVDQEYLPRASFRNLSDQIYSLDHFKDRVEICERWLFEYYKPMPPAWLDVAMRRIYEVNGDIQVSVLSNNVGCSSRHLNRHFLFDIGINVKTFIQMVRIQKVYQQRYLSPKNALNASLDVGYYDQAHFINTEKKMIAPPQRLFFSQIKSDYCNT